MPGDLHCVQGGCRQSLTDGSRDVHLGRVQGDCDLWNLFLATMSDTRKKVTELGMPFAPKAWQVYWGSIAINNLNLTNIKSIG
jgi:hypothetical protein